MKEGIGKKRREIIHFYSDNVFDFAHNSIMAEKKSCFLKNPVLRGNKRMGVRLK